MKIPFDIKFRQQIESGEYKVETEAGYPVKVLDWEYNDRAFEKCIAIKIIKGDGDYGLLYTHEGKRASIFPAEEGSDLFIVTPEPELSNEFEIAINRRLNLINGENLTATELLEETKGMAAELLELAKKELQEKVIQDYWKQAADRCVQAREEGKSEALKDLPRWSKCGEDTMRTDGDEHFEYRGECYLVMKHHEILLSDLEKLTGFND